jgi:hypothetical protein
MKTYPLARKGRASDRSLFHPGHFFTLVTFSPWSLFHPGHFFTLVTFSPWSLFTLVTFLTKGEK